MFNSKCYAPLNFVYNFQRTKPGTKLSLWEELLRCSRFCEYYSMKTKNQLIECKRRKWNEIVIFLYLSGNGNVCREWLMTTGYPKWIWQMFFFFRMNRFMNGESNWMIGFGNSHNKHRKKVPQDFRYRKWKMSEKILSSKIGKWRTDVIKSKKCFEWKTNGNRASGKWQVKRWWKTRASTILL